MANFRELLTELTARYPNEANRGKVFEYVCQWFLQNDPTYRDLFLYVWMWDEWPDREKYGFGIDIGIDLVAQTYEGERWAIQAKFYQDTLPTSDIDSFLAVSGSKYFPHRMLISTSELSKHGLKKLESQEKHTTCIFSQDLEKLPLDWLNFLGPQNQVEPTENIGFFGRAYRSFMGEDINSTPGEIFRRGAKRYRSGMALAAKQALQIDEEGAIGKRISGAKQAFRKGEQKALASMQQQARRDQRRVKGNDIRHLTEPLPEDVPPAIATDRYRAILTHVDIYKEVLETYAQGELAKASIELARQGADRERIDELYRQNPSQFRTLSFKEPTADSEQTDSNIEKLIQRAKKDGLIAFLVENDPYTYDDEVHAESTLRSMPEQKLRSILKKAHKEFDKAPDSILQRDNEGSHIVESESVRSNLPLEATNEIQTTDHEEKSQPENATAKEVSEIDETPANEQNLSLVAEMFQGIVPEIELPQDFVNFYRQFGYEKEEAIKDWKPLIDNVTWKQIIQDWKIGIEEKAKNNGDISSDFILIKLNQDTEEAPLGKNSYKISVKFNVDKADANLSWGTKSKDKFNKAAKKAKKWKVEDKLDESSVQEATEVYRLVMAHAVRYEGLMKEDTQFKLLELAELAIRRGAEVDPSKQV